MSVVDPMYCHTGLEYILGTSNPYVLEGYLDEAISDIKDELFLRARSPLTSAIMPIKTRTLLGISISHIAADRRILELSEQDWYLNTPSRWHNARGIQYPVYDKILLKKGNWCRETVLHEALHRLSIFSSDLELRIKYPILEDGTTEFFVGFVLFKKYADCYSNWKQKTFRVCSMTYSHSVMRFYAFCNFISMASLINLYFWQPERSWERAWTGFISDIHESGYPTFRDVIDLSLGIEPTEFFFEECEERLGNDFGRLCSSQIDYNSIKI